MPRRGVEPEDSNIEIGQGEEINTGEDRKSAVLRGLQDMSDRAKQEQPAMKGGLSMDEVDNMTVDNMKLISKHPKEQGREETKFPYR
ncbi:hypothetical protein RRG08_047238 [Elysia crispata]|uniref:Uncharacterized protein n=1 Tax=Elysia crispata TaxID=231223 RepID=A0AAE1A2R0_9GAST|nr:hypothetical protein RRG08_047238 [Elysia crispata]